MTAPRLNAYARLTTLGFAPVPMGGNTTALRRDYPDGTYHLITLADSPSAPDADTPPDTLCALAMYEGDHPEPIADECEDSLADIARLFAHHTPQPE